MSTPKFELPENCPVCGSVRTEWNMSNRHGTEQEYATYRCMSSLNKYTSRRDHSVNYECPQTPKNLKIAERNRVIDTRVSAVLKELKLSKEELDAFAIRTDRGRWDKTADSIYKYFKE